VGLTETPIQPSVKLDGNHPIEVSDIKWVSITDPIVKKYTDPIRSALARIS
jgi:hypothetical protein